MIKTKKYIYNNNNNNNKEPWNEKNKCIQKLFDIIYNNILPIYYYNQ